MKRHGNLFSKIISIDNLRLADKIARKGKLKQYGVQKHILNAESNLKDLHIKLKNKEFITSEYLFFIIFDGKEREISTLPYYPDRIVHRAIMNVIEPILVNIFTVDTYSCIKGRGVHAASFKLRKYLKNISDTRYCLKLDIRKFYSSVDNDILKTLLRRKFKDEDLLCLLDNIIDSHKGLPLGSLTSQYLSNFYLTYFDHFAKEQLKKKYYLRYADDIVILSENKSNLHIWFKEINYYLCNELNLEIKGNYQIFPVEKRGIDWVGYVHYHSHVKIRKTIKKKYIKNKVKLNHYGWLKHCNSINLRNKYENS